jgi:hypothetical protein
LPTGQNTGWMPVTYLWTQFAQPSYSNDGTAFTTHLKKVLSLQWGLGDNGAMTNTTTDFWLDNVQFLP